MRSPVQLLQAKLLQRLGSTYEPAAAIFGPCFDAESEQIEHDDEHEHDSLTSGSSLNDGSDPAQIVTQNFRARGFIVQFMAETRIDLEGF